MIADIYRNITENLTHLGWSDSDVAIPFELPKKNDKIRQKFFFIAYGSQTRKPYSVPQIDWVTTPVKVIATFKYDSALDMAIKKDEVVSASEKLRNKLNWHNSYDKMENVRVEFKDGQRFFIAQITFDVTIKGYTETIFFGLDMGDAQAVVTIWDLGGSGTVTDVVDLNAYQN